MAEIFRRSGWCPRAALALGLGALVPLGSDVHAQGLSAEARENIRVLFNRHDAIRRSLTLTDDGYRALTEADDPELVKVLQAHVRQMEQRLEEGLAVRRWDPAFAEYRAHYREMELKIDSVTNGVRVVARGLTPEAVRVVQNHATVINDFVHDGWAAHDATHRAVLSDRGDAVTPAQSAGQVGRGKGQRWRGGRAGQGGEACCRDREHGCERKCARDLSEPQRN